MSIIRLVSERVFDVRRLGAVVKASAEYPGLLGLYTTRAGQTEIDTQTAQPVFVLGERETLSFETDQNGRLVVSILEVVDEDPPGGGGGEPGPTARSVTRHGITWHFDREYEVGRYANGDWWVVGPVTLTAIDPASVAIGGRIVNGSMVNPTPRLNQLTGADSGFVGSSGDPIRYDDSLNVARRLPLSLTPGDSLCSTVSNLAGGDYLTAKMAVLTVVERAPAPGAFRPPYTGTAIPESWNVSNLQPHLLGQLEAVTGTPTLQSLLAKMENPLWGDQHPGWIATGAFAPGNSPTYGRDISSLHGEAALALHLDFPMAEKMPLLIALVQRGIDCWGIAVEGGEENWTPNGGHASGRKWPILFAMLMLGDIGDLTGDVDTLFGEDAQTWIVDASDIGRNGYTAEWVGRPEWGIRHATSPQHDNPSILANYRTCCTANAWGGFVMAARIMGALEAWGHNALFAYYDRYVREIFPATGLADWQLDYSDSRWVVRTYNRYRPDFGA